MTFKKTSMALFASALLATTLTARDQIKIVGSSTVYPFSSLLAIAYSTWFYQNFFKHYYKDAGIVFLKSLAAVLCVQLVIGLSAGVYIIIKMIQLSSQS